MDELIQAMTDADLTEFKAKNPTNESLNTLIDGILAKRASDTEAEVLRGKFTKEVDKLIAKLPHPEDVHNVYIRWAECEVTDKDAEPVEVTLEGIKDDNEMVVEATDMADDDADALTAYIAKHGVVAQSRLEIVAELATGKLTVKRQPTRKVNKWVVDLNKGFNVGTGDKTVKTATKRGVTLHKRNGLALEFAGNFPSGAIACKHLNIDKGTDSAIRVLQRAPNNYIVDDYTGTDYTAS